MPVVDLADHRQDGRRKRGIRMTLTAQPSRSSFTLRVYWSREALRRVGWDRDPMPRVTLRYDDEKHTGEVVLSKKGWRIVKVKAGGGQLQMPYHGNVPAFLGAVEIDDYLAGKDFLRFPWPWPPHAFPYDEGDVDNV